MIDPKKTRLSLAGRTVVMESPPEMTIVLGPEAQKRTRSDPGATRMARPAASSRPPRPSSSQARTARFERVAPPRVSAPPRVPPPRVSPPPLPTRMVDLRDALKRPPLPPLPPLPQERLPQPPPGTPSPLLRADHRSRFSRVGPTIVGATAVCGLLLAALLLDTAADAPVPPTTEIAEATGEPPVLSAERAARALGSSSEPERAHAKQESRHPLAIDPAVTKEQAASLLLSGRREEALALYRQLEVSADAGIEAFVIVLEQKVDSP